MGHRERKRAAEMLLSRVPRLDPEDTALLAEAKAIEERRRAEEKARRPTPREPSSPLLVEADVRAAISPCMCCMTCS